MSITKRFNRFGFNSSLSSIKEKLEHYEFHTINQLLEKATTVESHLKESCGGHRTHCPNVHVIESYSDSLDDENKEYNAADEFV